MTPQEPEFRKITSNDASYSPFELRVWHGISLDVWLKIMRGRWGKVSVRRYPLVATITVFSMFTLVTKVMVHVVFGKKIAHTEITQDPVFVLGHFRSGTTWLHETLANDPAFCGTSSIACFNPDGFVLGRVLATSIMTMFAPKTRPMDNVTVDADTMQEDEIGLLLSGAPTPYQSLLLPCEPADTFPQAEISKLEPDQLQAFRAIWLGFLRKVQFCHPGKRLLLKSPLHTTRIDEIIQLFPNAKFVHIVRDPYKILASNLKTLASMKISQGLQDHIPTDAVLQTRTLENFVTFHEQYDAKKHLIPPQNLVTIRYEDLRADVPGVLRRVYEALELGDFDAVADSYVKAAEHTRAYKANKLNISPEVMALVDEKWHRYFEQYGYLTASERTDSTI